jgi:hypothetical protein
MTSEDIITTQLNKPVLVFFVKMDPHNKKVSRGLEDALSVRQVMLMGVTADENGYDSSPTLSI